MQQQNQVLSTMTTIPVFGLHPEALYYVVKNNYDRLETLLSIIEECPVIYGIEETNKTKEFGKCFFITDKSNLTEAQRFIDEDLKKAFYKLDTRNLARFQFKYFHHPRRSDFNRSKAMADAAKNLEESINSATTTMPKRAPSRNIPRRFEVSFNPPEQKENAWNVPLQNRTVQPQMKNPYQKSSTTANPPTPHSQNNQNEKQTETTNDTDSKLIDEKIKAAIARNQPSTLSEIAIQSRIDASTSSLRADIKHQQEMIKSLKKENKTLQEQNKYPDASDLQQTDRILPNAVEDRMDAFRLELKQKQAEILQQAAMTTSQFDTEYVDRRIEEAASRLSQHFEESISNVHVECKKQIAVTNKAVKKLEKQLEKVSDNLEKCINEALDEIRNDNATVRNEFRTSVESIEASIATNGKAMKSAFFEAIKQLQSNPSSLVLPEKKRSQRDTAHGEAIPATPADTAAIPPSIEDTPMQDQENTAKNELQLPSL